MKFAITASNQIAIMLVIMLIAVVLYRIKLIDAHANKVLSNLLLMVINPIILFNSFQADFQIKLVWGLFYSAILAVIGMSISILIAYLFIPKREDERYIIERFCSIYSNCGFFGIPLVYSLFGNEGVFYLTAYMSVFNILIWTHGVMMMKKENNVKELFKAFRSPSIIAVFIGLICFFGRIRLPEIIMSPLVSLGNMNTPLAMLIAGVSLSQTNILAALKNKRLYVVCLLKLIIIPVASILVFKLFHLSDIIIITSVLEAACPAATTGVMFAIRFDKDYKYASELFAITTVLSLVTIPIVVFLASL